MKIVEITDDTVKMKVTADILNALQEWFELDDAREEYIRSSVGKAFFCAYENDNPVGFLYLKQTGKDTVELAVMGILKEYHRMGMGTESAVSDHGYSFIQVKTVARGKYPEFDKTNDFYVSLGFKELEIFPTLWDEQNPCQIYIMAI